MYQYNKPNFVFNFHNFATETKNCATFLSSQCQGMVTSYCDCHHTAFYKIYQFI